MNGSVGLSAVVVLGVLLAGCAAPAPDPVERTPGLRAFTGGRLIIGNTGAVVESGTLVIRDGRIEAVGATDTIAVPPDTEQISIAGKTIIPGMINAHGHVSNVRGLETNPAFYTEEHVRHQLGVYARYGVTSVFSLGGGGPAGVAVRDGQGSDLVHARLYLAGPIVTGGTPDEVVEQVNAVADLGADIVKIRVDDNLGSTQKMAPDVYRSVIDQAHERGLPLAAHLYYLEDAKGLLEAGADLIAHSVRDDLVDDELIALLTQRDVCYCPTLMREVSTFVYEQRPDWFDDPFFRNGVEESVIEALEAPEYQERIRSRPSTQIYKAALSRAQQNLKALADGGVRVAMGTDTGPGGRFQGYFEHRELNLMVEAGLTPMQVIVSATGDAARCMQVDDAVGTLEAGKWADFVVLGANPLQDIQNTRTIDSVWIAGNQVPGSSWN